MPTLKEMIEALYAYVNSGFSARDFIEDRQRRQLEREIKADLEYGRS